MTNDQCTVLPHEGGLASQEAVVGGVGGLDIGHGEWLIAGDGALVAHTRNGPVTFSAPIAWQEVDGFRRQVHVAYVLDGYRYRFKLGSYDRTLPVVIDPLLQATYLGGSAADEAFAMALDAAGNVYIAGTTLSPNFPATAGGAQPSLSGPTDIYGVYPKDGFVAKLDRDLGTVMQATYFGGTASDEIRAMALDAKGNVFVTGSTRANDLPGTGGGARPLNAGGYNDAFVAKLADGLTVLAGATYLGGAGSEYAYALGVDLFGNVVVAGRTDSDDFPGVNGGAQSVRIGLPDAFVSRLNNELTTLAQSTYLGGSRDNQARAIAVDSNGTVFVAGTTSSPDFPGTAGGAQSEYAQSLDGFVSRLNPALTTLTRSTYLGGAWTDEPSAIALDRTGNVFVAGATSSKAFPGTASGAQELHGGGVNDAFVAKLNYDLTMLLQATYLGGNANDRARTLAVDGEGNVYVAGSTESPDFPAVEGGIQPIKNGFDDGFIASLDSDLKTLVQATYFGGSSTEWIFGIAHRDGEAIYAAGTTASGDLPGTAGGAQESNATTSGLSNNDAFVVKMTAGLRLTDPPTPMARAIEYYHAGLVHYFVTADLDEIAGLDAHVYPPVFGGNWERTGQSFSAQTARSSGNVPVCRFFGAFGAKSSHFYTADPVECAGLTARFPNWQFENLAFYLPLPDASGTCPSGTAPIYRMYNNGQGGAPNHRFTTDLATRLDFVANHGWIQEGTGPMGVAMCSPQAPTAGTAEGIWIGSTAAQSLIEAFVLDDGTYYFLYSLPNSYNIGGMIQGHGVSVEGSFDTADARDFSVSGRGVTMAALAADYVSKSSLDGNLTFSLGSTSFATDYQATYEQPASLAAASGTYQGLAGTATGIQPITLTASPNGAIVGSAFDCMFNATAAPRGSVNIFNLSITFNGGGCLFGTSTLVGFAYYDAATGQLLAFGVNASRTDSILFIGARP